MMWCYISGRCDVQPYRQNAPKTMLNVKSKYLLRITCIFSARVPPTSHNFPPTSNIINILASRPLLHIYRPLLHKYNTEQPERYCMK